MIKTKDVLYRVDKAVLLRSSTLEFRPGLFHVIMGANGAGKSTLLKLLAGQSRPSGGAVFLDGTDLRFYSSQQLATRRAVLSQHYHLAFPVSAMEIVLMGRYPYFATKPSAKDLAICNASASLLDASHLLLRDYNTLSGGEAQKVQMSRVLAQIWNDNQQAGKLLFLDEPVSHLDVKYQHQLLQAAKALCRQGTTVIAVLHDVNLALRFADRILFMKGGSVRYTVEKAEQVDGEMLEDVFGIRPLRMQMEGRLPFVLF